MSYIEQILQKAPQMSESFLHIADYLLNSYIDASFMTASELAEILNVDAATIVRFSQSIGYKGYPNLLRDIQSRVKHELSLSISRNGVPRSNTNSEGFGYEYKLLQKRSDMSPSYVQIADYLLDSYIDASFMTASELAKTLNRDAGTIVRFSQFLGYTGFPQLHNALAERAKSFIMEYMNNVDIIESSLYEEIMAKRAIADRVKSNETILMQNILAQQVVTIREYLKGRSSNQLNDERLCDWIQFCYSFEMYSEARSLFTLINPNDVNPWYYERTKKIVRLCSIHTSG